MTDEDAATKHVRETSSSSRRDLVCATGAMYGPVFENKDASLDGLTLAVLELSPTSASMKVSVGLK